MHIILSLKQSNLLTRCGFNGNLHFFGVKHERDRRQYFILFNSTKQIMFIGNLWEIESSKFPIKLFWTRKPLIAPPLYTSKGCSYFSQQQKKDAHTTKDPNTCMILTSPFSYRNHHLNRISIEQPLPFHKCRVVERESKKQTFPPPLTARASLDCVLQLRPRARRGGRAGRWRLRFRPCHPSREDPCELGMLATYHILKRRKLHGECMHIVHQNIYEHVSTKI